MTNNPVLQQVSNKYKLEVRQKAILSPSAERSSEKVQTFNQQTKAFLMSIRDEIRAFFGSIRSKVKQSLTEGEETANRTFLPDPEITMLKSQGYTSIPRGCSIFGYNNSERILEKAVIEEVEVEDERGKMKRKVVIQKPGFTYFSALNEKTAKSKVGIL